MKKRYIVPSSEIVVLRVSSLLQEPQINGGGSVGTGTKTNFNQDVHIDYGGVQNTLEGAKKFNMWDDFEDED